MKLFQIAIGTFLSLVLMIGISSCGSDSPSTKPDDPEAEVSFTIASSYEIVKSDRNILPLAKTGTVDLANDAILLEGNDGRFTTCSFAGQTDTEAQVLLPASFVNGDYVIYYRHNAANKRLGQASISVVEKSFEPQPGTTVYGVVRTADGPVADVLVSDGYEFTKTNAEGQYELQSLKQLGYVFMVVPSGYEPQREGVFPKVYALTEKEANVAEVHNFDLVKVGNQDNHKILFLGDMHLAKRNGDMSQFGNFVNEINAYAVQHTSDRVYAITLGDMTWDIYWNAYTLGDYHKDINSLVKNLMIYHCIGNHDNDYKTTDNAHAKWPFAQQIAPTYYSFNIGKVHYIILDDIDCSTYDGTTSRNYKEQLTADQMAWLRKDLSFVPQTTPVVVVMHAPAYDVSGLAFKTGLTNTTELANALSGYNVQIVTGHTHKNYNVTSNYSVLVGRTIFEHNVGAVCGSWWWSGHLSGDAFHLAPDGTPGGYAIWDINGTDMQWLYKGTGCDENVQFRTYDLNQVGFSFDDVPNLPASSTTPRNAFKRYIDQYPKNSNKNEILINVWNWDPEWTVTATAANGQQIALTRVSAYDPLHIAQMSVKRFNNNTTSTPNFITQSYPHFFKGTAPDATSTVTVTVKDQFGHTWTEQMVRPKKFDLKDMSNYAHK